MIRAERNRHSVDDARGPCNVRRMRKHAAALTVTAIAILGAVACDRPGGAPIADSPVATDSAASVSRPRPRATPEWDALLGPAILIAASTPTEGTVILPGFTDTTFTDSTTFQLAPVSGLTVDLFARSGLVGQARIASASAPTRNPGCAAWPVAMLALEGPSPRWAVALESGRAFALPLDSIEALAGADSARLVADVARMASRLPDDSASEFRGLPFIVLHARRFRATDAVDALVAQVARRISLEASPREERTMFIAERSHGDSAATFAPVYHERQSGSEESVEALEVLTALAIGPARTPTLVRVHDFGDGTVYSLLERDAQGRWHVSWSSAYAGC
jgi:hypothetical protein